MSNANRKTWQPINFTAYLSFIKWPVLLAVVVELAFRYFALKYWTTLSPQNLEIITWAWRGLIFIWLGRRTFLFFGYNLIIPAMVGLFSGTIIGVIVSLSRFADGFKVWKIFNIVTETTSVVIVSCLLIWLIAYLWHFFKR